MSERFECVHCSETFESEHEATVHQGHAGHYVVRGGE